MWTVVYIAPGEREAENIRKLLTREGLLVKLRKVGPPVAENNSSVEVLVPESEADEAMEIISLT